MDYPKLYNNLKVILKKKNLNPLLINRLFLKMKNFEPKIFKSKNYTLRYQDQGPRKYSLKLLGCIKEGDTSNIVVKIRLILERYSAATKPRIMY